MDFGSKLINFVIMEVKGEPMAFDEDIRKCVETLRRGGIILYPTDTVWGIGCDASNDSAVEKVFALKHRSDSKSLILLVDSPRMLEHSVENVPEVAWQLIDAAVEPLTIVYDHAVASLSKLCVAADGSVGVRMTHERFSSELCRRFGRAIVSTSANISGEPTPRNFSEISEAIRKGVDYAAGYRRDEMSKGKSSAIIKVSDDATFKILR